MDCISTGQYKVINIDSLYEEFEEIFYSVFLKMAQMFLLLGNNCDNSASKQV